jgi:hypothetical protein
MLTTAYRRTAWPASTVFTTNNNGKQQWGQVLSFASPRRGAMAFIRLALQESRPDPGGSGGFLLSLKLRALALLAARTG